jgi:hypothetical protein
MGRLGQAEAGLATRRVGQRGERGTAHALRRSWAAGACVGARAGERGKVRVTTRLGKYRIIA